MPLAVEGATVPSAAVVDTVPSAAAVVVAPSEATVVIVPSAPIVGAVLSPTLSGAIVPSANPLARFVLTVAGSNPALVTASGVNVPLSASPNKSGLTTPTANNAAAPIVAHPPGMLLSTKLPTLLNKSPNGLLFWAASFAACCAAAACATWDWSNVFWAWAFCDCAVLKALCACT